MTIPATASQITYAGDDVSTTFAIPFIFDTSADLKVILTDPDGEPTEITTGFSISGGGGSTGELELDDPLEEDYTLTILDDPELTQPVDYTDNDAFAAETHEGGLDRSTRQIKRLHQRVDRSLRVADGDLANGDELVIPIVATRQGMFLGFNSLGQPVALSGTGNDDARREDLANGTPGLVDSLAVAHARTDAETTSSVTLANPHLEPGIDYRYGVTGDGTTDDTAATIAAINTFSVVDNFSYTLRLPDGTRSVSNVTFQNRTHLIGQSLEGTRYKARPGTSGDWFNDEGSGAKVELYNITFDGNNEAGIDTILKLGVDDIQFGTYGSADNLMARGAPNATAFDIDTNIVVTGKWYSMDTANGLISRAAGTGFHAQAITPYNFTEIGVQLSLGDSVSFVEAEAPGADTAVPLVLERGGYVANYFLAISPSRVVRTPMRINVTHVGHFLLGPTTVTYRDSTAKYGDTTNPNVSSTATSATATSLTDTTKTWGLDQWMGAACHITAGTGSGQWARVTGNSRDTLQFLETLSPAPDNTSTYKLSYFIRHSTDGGGALTGAGDGYGHSGSITAYHPWFKHLSVGGAARVNSLVVGNSNVAVAITGIMKAVATLNFASVSANAVGTPLTVNVHGAQVGMPVVLGIPDAIASLGLVLTPTVSSTGVVSIYPKNLTGSPIDAPSATYVIQVFDYA